MVGLKTEENIIIHYLVEKYKKTKSKIQKDIYENDLIEYIKEKNLSNIDSLLIYLNKEIEKVYLLIIEYNHKNKTKEFEEMISDLFKKDSYQEYLIENISLSNDIKNEIDFIKSNDKNYKITDDLIVKLINTLKSRVVSKESKKSYDLPWAPEALISLELLKNFMKERVELYYLTPCQSHNRFYSSIDSIIVEQRLNPQWIKENEKFLKENELEIFCENERTILTDLLDFLPELQTVKFGVSLNFPEKSIEDRLLLILNYFEKSEIDYKRKNIALKLINLFFNKFIFNEKSSLISFKGAKNIINEIEKNVEKTYLEEQRLTLKPKKTDLNKQNKLLDNNIENTQQKINKKYRKKNKNKNKTNV